MKIGDNLLINGEYTKVACVDGDSDIWYEVSNGVTGSSLITDVEVLDYHAEYMYQIDHTFKECLLYDYRVQGAFKKIVLTKLARKMYSIDDSFTGDLYILKEGL